MDCKTRLCQFDTALGNLGSNLAAHEVQIARAVADGIELIAFPELSLTGYFLKDQTAEVALGLDAAELARLAQASQAISIIAGFVEKARDGRLYNALGFFEDGRLISVHRKVHLVTYGMFEEQRDFAAGERFVPVESKLGRFGLLTCEDAWHIDGAYLYFLDGVDALLIASAGPGRGVTAAETPREDGRNRLGSGRVWETLQEALGLFFRTWVLYVNRAGWEDGIVFGGGTRAVDPFGRTHCAGLGLDPGCLDLRLDSSRLERSRIQTPLRRDERPGLFLRELTRRLDTGEI